MQHIKLVNSSGGVLNGSTSYDVTNYYEAVPLNALERVLWLEADPMRALKVDDENLKNQRDVVKEEVRVNVMNQPYGGFPGAGHAAGGGSQLGQQPKYLWQLCRPRC